MPSFLLLVMVCAGAATLGANNLEASAGSAAGYLAVSAATGVGMVLRLKAAILAPFPARSGSSAPASFERTGPVS